MQVILYLIIISLLVAGGFLGAFFWAVHNGQYEDDLTPSIRILIDEDMLISDDQDQPNTNSVSTNKLKQNVKN